MTVKHLHALILFSILLASCSRPIRPTQMITASPIAALTHSPTPTRTETQPPTPAPTMTRTPIQVVKPTPAPTEPEAVREYLGRLKKNFFSGGFCCLSNDGQWMLTDKAPYRYDVDTLDVVSVNDPQSVIHLPITRDLIQPPAVSESVARGGYGYSMWSPDSTGIAWGAGVTNTLVFTVLMIYDISDPLNVKSAVFKPEESKIPEFDGYPGNAVFLQPRWSPDSAKVLVMFGKTFDSAREYGWIVDRNGRVLKELFTQGYNALFWVDDRLVGAKDGKEIWLIDPWRDTQERLYVSETEIEIIEYKSSYNQLLFTENKPSTLVVFDVQTKLVVTRVSPGVSLDGAENAAVSTPSNYTGIRSGSSFYIFDWETYTVSDDLAFSDSTGYLGFIGWFPIVNGFIAMDLAHSLRIIR